MVVVGGEDKVDRYYFMRPLLRWLASAANFNHMAAIVLRTAGVLVALFSLVLFFKVGKFLFEQPVTQIPGGVVFELFFVVAVYCVVHGLFIRASDIDHLPVDTYNTFRLAAVIARALGETTGAFAILVSAGSAAYVWLTAKGIGTLLGLLPDLLPVIGVSSFMGGIQLMAGGVLSGVAILVISYLIAEAFNMIADVAAGAARPAATVASDRAEVRRRSGTG
jgi:hypothetical protein